MFKGLLTILMFMFLLFLASSQNLAAEDDPTSPDYINLEELETPEFLAEVK